MVINVKSVFEGRSHVCCIGKSGKKLMESEKWSTKTLYRKCTDSQLCASSSHKHRMQLVHVLVCHCSNVCNNIDICRQRIELYLFLQIFEQVLSELEPLCLAEQDFISKFFKLQQHPAVIPPLAQVSL